MKLCSDKSFNRCARAASRFIFALIGLLVFSCAHAESKDKTLLANIGARLSSAAVVNQHFVQEKQLRVLKRPIRTEGLLLYRRDAGVCWHTRLPVVSTLVLGEQQLRQINGDDELVLKAEQQPALFGFTRLFFAALSGRVDTLSEHFQARVEGDENHWRLDLIPRDALLKKFIESMHLEGGDRVERVRVAGYDGDMTRIEFSAPIAADDINTVERRCFVR